MNLKTIGMLAAVAVASLTNNTPLVATTYIQEANYAEDFASKIDPFWANGLEGIVVGEPYKRPLRREQAVDISVRYFLQDDAKANVFLVHGFRNYKEIFKETAYDFFNRGYNVITYDLRGHGRSSRLSENTRWVYFDSYENQVKDLQSIVKTFGSNGLKNVAYTFSMGGLITSLAIQEDPELFAAVSMASPLFEFDSSPYPLFVARGITGISTFFGQGDELAPGQEGPLAEPGPFEEASTSSFVRWQSIVDYKFRPENVEHLHIKGATFNWVLQTIKTIREVNKEDRAALVKTPVLLFQGEKDTVVLAPGQEAYCDVTPTCELEVSLGSKHAIFNETDAIRQLHLDKTFSFFNSQL